MAMADLSTRDLIKEATKQANRAAGLRNAGRSTSYPVGTIRALIARLANDRQLVDSELRKALMDIGPHTPAAQIIHNLLDRR